MSIENDIKGTPIEELKKDAEALRRFRTTEGYKVLLNLVRGHEANLLREFLSDTEVDEKQLRANCRAWHNVIQIIDDTVDAYDTWLEQTIKMQKQQEQKAKGFNNGQ